MNDTAPRRDSESPCLQYRFLMGDLVADELDCLRAARIEQHAIGCLTCRRALASVRALQRSLRRVGRAERASSALRDRVYGLQRALRDSERT